MGGSCISIPTHWPASATALQERHGWELHRYSHSHMTRARLLLPFKETHLTMGLGLSHPMQTLP